MKVKAKQLGFYGNKKKAIGTIFNLSDGEKDFSDKWMEKIEGDKKPAPIKASKAKASKGKSVELKPENDVI